MASDGLFCAATLAYFEAHGLSASRSAQSVEFDA
jgi:hypothetical protein